MSRRTPAVSSSPVLRHGGVTLDQARHEATVEGRLLDLTPKEFAVLHLLLEAGGAPVPHDVIVRTLWDENLDPRTSAVRATVSRLRGKLGDPGLISADTGRGYRLCD
ncbi:Transcriptional regulatory protein, C terminal [Actinacidiphila alni]|uniref:Transcriptional regulatory protein, C terminal n=1 Tax=Actinacidiphila alni TaxID=380248 RepID=A0A1I2AMK2_9ACTN|nr:winged helix-turn-helix domain-containing protein [Actinacidiphila alni]SFE45132.1 Transcriptional regulatory protein, C terminal [Actinacidiphila alni]